MITEDSMPEHKPSKTCAGNDFHSLCVAIQSSMQELLEECDREFLEKYLALALWLEPKADLETRQAVIDRLHSLRQAHGYTGPKLMAFENKLIETFSERSAGKAPA